MLTSLLLHVKNGEVCIKTRSPPALLPIQGKSLKNTTVKWPIAGTDLGGVARAPQSPLSARQILFFGQNIQ